MTEPLDSDLAPIAAEYDRLAARAVARGMTPGVHPNRFGELARLEELTTSAGGPTRLSAVQAVIRLAPAEDRLAFCRVTTNFATGVIGLHYFGAEGDHKGGGDGHITHHDLYVGRGDEHQYVQTGMDLARIGAAALSLLRAGQIDAARRIVVFLETRRGEFGGIFPRLGWPSFASLLEAAPRVTDAAKTAEGLTRGRWIAVAEYHAGGMSRGWWIDLFRFDEVSTEYGFFLRAVRGQEGLRFIPDPETGIPAFPGRNEAELTIGAGVELLEPTKIFEVPDDVIETLRNFIPPDFPISFELSL